MSTGNLYINGNKQKQGSDFMYLGWMVTKGRKMHGRTVKRYRWQYKGGG